MELRDNRLDTIKGLLIASVVLVHVISLVDYGDSGLIWGVRAFIHTVTIPLFVLVSGYFTNIGCKRKFFDGLINIGVSLAIFQSISLLLLFLCGQFKYSQLLIPWWALWYLLSMIWWRIMLYFTPKRLLDNPLVYLVVVFFISLLSGFISHGKVLSIQRTLSFYPFFLLGYYFRQGTLKSKPWCNTVSYIIVLVTVTLIVFNLYPDNSRVLLSGLGRYSYTDIPAKIYLLLLSTITSVSLFNIVKRNKLLATIGRDSMLYYLYHGFIIYFILSPLVEHFSLPMSFPFLLIYCLTIMTLIYFIGKIKLFKFLVNPITFSTNNSNK